LSFMLYLKFFFEHFYPYPKPPITYKHLFAYIIALYLFGLGRGPRFEALTSVI